MRTGADVLHLLRARRGIRAHEQALDDDERIPRTLVLDFHRTVTSYTENPMVAAMTRIALDPALDHVEATLDVILETRHTSHENVAEHASIVDALAAGDADAAAAAMTAHLDRLIGEATAFMDRYDATLVDRLLAASQ